MTLKALGTGVAVLMAGSPEPARTPPAAMVPEAPYTTPPDITRHLYPKLKPLLFMMKNKWPGILHIRNLQKKLSLAEKLGELGYSC